MKGPFLIKDRINGNYRSQYDETWTNDSSRARVYARVCDAKNSMNNNGCKGTNTFDKNYELIPCIVLPINELTEVRHRKQKKNYKVTSNFAAPSTNCGPKIFTSLAQAQEHARQWGHERGLHLDYFTITPTDEAPARIRPDWTEYFLGLALIVSKRSHDQHTQHGCVLVDSKSKHILATGYNGFPKNMQDNTLPTQRPDKYKWMIHSEVNACCNLTKSADEHTVAYITGQPCTPCLLHLWQTGICHVIHRKAYGSIQIDEEMIKNRNILIKQTGMKLEEVDTNLDWLNQCLKL